MTSKIVVNNIEADAGVSTVTFNSNVERGSSNLHSTGLNVNDTFVHSTGIALGAGSTVGAVTGVTTYYGDGSQLTGITVDTTKIETGTTKIQTSATLITNQVSGAGIATVQAGGMDVTGIVTATNVSVGSSVTAGTFHGNGAGITGVSAGKLLRKTSYFITRQSISHATFPNDDTIPQITEGTQFFSQEYTPSTTIVIFLSSQIAL